MADTEDIKKKLTEGPASPQTDLSGRIESRPLRRDMVDDAPRFAAVPPYGPDANRSPDEQEVQMRKP